MVEQQRLVYKKCTHNTMICLLILVSSECERYQVPRQEWPPHADPCEETLQMSLRQELQDLAGPETPHHQLPPARLHRDPAQDSRLEAAATQVNDPKQSPILTVLTRPFYIPSPHTKGSSACFKFSFSFFLGHLFCLFYIYFFLSMLYHLYFKKQNKCIFVVFLMLYICTFVYAITFLFFYCLTDIRC